MGNKKGSKATTAKVVPSKSSKAASTKKPTSGKRTAKSKLAARVQPASKMHDPAPRKAPRRRKPSAKKPHISALAAALQLLPASGDRGFEGLVERLLTKLTGTSFLVRRSGSQQGRDIDSESVFVECKRYEESTELDERGLLTQV